MYRGRILKTEPRDNVELTLDDVSMYVFGGCSRSDEDAIFDELEHRQLIQVVDDRFSIDPDSIDQNFIDAAKNRRQNDY